MLDVDLEDLLVNAQKGDKDSYREFLQQASLYIAQNLKRKIGINDYNDDIAQEVLLGIHKNLSTYNPKYPVKAWLSGIIRFKVADYFRRIGLDQEKLILSDEETFDQKQEEIQPEKSFGNKLLVQSFLGELPECTKNAVILTKVKGHTTKEVSEMLGIKEVNLRKQLSRAMKYLVQRFEFYE